MKPIQSVRRDGLAARHRQLDALLPHFRALWHPQPFREIRPAWCRPWPALAAELLALDDERAEALNADAPAALGWLVRHLPDVAAIAPLAELPVRAAVSAGTVNDRWAWEIPGRKRAQIEAFAAVARCGRRPVLDWCGGKGHLGRLLAGYWQVPVQTLEIDAALCRAGERLAQRLGIDQSWIATDALGADLRVLGDRHAVALHACGELHRRLIRDGATAGIACFDIAPCCYHLHLNDGYRPLAAASSLALTPDDVRLAVTETVTAGARERRQRDRAIAFKLGFAAWRGEVSGESYRSFKPVPEAWLRGDFAAFMAAMCQREGVVSPSAGDLARCERRGGERQREVLRLSIVRHALRRALEVWLAGDLAVSLAEHGYAVELGVFCARALTPRNLLISARRG
ncbi:MAG: SAM-dependent methyltransferase [Azonexus sp.]|uniref:methyltransferase n=1 Tax=Azonexus sp. TaxID=1872668 RepID=UPI00282D03EC|nr:methyltransferase [Azonexus sp.]MDR0775347.1 SAM-dependent methyltransferase [Azonexus sp.]